MLLDRDTGHKWRVMTSGRGTCTMLNSSISLGGRILLLGAMRKTGVSIFALAA